MVTVIRLDDKSNLKIFVLSNLDSGTFQAMQTPSLNCCQFLGIQLVPYLERQLFSIDEEKVNTVIQLLSYPKTEFNVFFCI